MFIAAAIVSVLLALVLAFSAVGKLTRNPQQVESMTNVGFPVDRMWLLALAELAGAVGLIVGLFWWPIGLAAAIGVVAYFLGAILMHLRANDKTIAPAGVLMLVAIAVAVLVPVAA
ncbi:DoxX family protein [Rhodococcus sp. NPDC127528]|uniref:DoxX family protein n=1 Tax=unclassified Rhodococcus (in: high G+C Gram-positive bacteria) TaxID=192944 RepID=UPI00362CD311